MCPLAAHLRQSKGYTSIVVGYFEGTLLDEREDAALYPSVYYVLVIYGVVVSEQYAIEFPCFLFFWGYFIKTCCFPVFIFILFFLVLRRVLLV